MIAYILRVVNKIIKLLKGLIINKKHFSLPQAPIFIIGAPRSGSTVLYQAITSALDVAYINNLSCGLHGSFSLGFRLSKLLYGEKRHRCFSSQFGRTIHGGYNAPSECGAFWYRWLPRDRHFIDWDDINRHMVEEIRTEMAQAMRITGQPLVFKNLNAGQRLRLISKIAPDAKIIHIDRDLRYNIQSILLARKKNKIAEGAWWSIKPPDYEKYLSLPEVAMCSAQVKAITAQIEADRSLFPSYNWIDIAYEDFLNDPGMVVRSLVGFIGRGIVSEENIGIMKEEVGKSADQKVKVTEAEWEEIVHVVDDRRIDEKVIENTRFS